MPRKKTRAKNPDEIYTYIVVLVDNFEAETEMGVNSDVYHPQYAWASRDEDALYAMTSQVRINGVCTYPDERAGDSYHLTLYSDDSPARWLRATLKEAQLRDKNGMPKYRTYRGREIPVYDAPKGLAVLDKVRGKPEWSAWINVKPRMVAETLLLTGQNRQLFLTLQEWKFERKHWIRSFGLQTTNPEGQ